MKIKCRAESTPKIQADHDGKIRKMKPREQSDDAEDLDQDQDGEDKQIKLFVKRRWQRIRGSNPCTSLERAVS